MHEHGRGVAASRSEAVRLYRLAAREGQEQAQASLRRLGETW
jgi:TPR repeat protein